MLRTNSKKAKENIHNYIIAHIKSDIEEAIKYYEGLTEAEKENDADAKARYITAKAYNLRNNKDKENGNTFTHKLLMEAAADFIIATYAGEKAGSDCNMASGNTMYFFEHEFIYWSYGLTCGELFDFHTNDPINDLGDILEETEAERGKYSRTKAADLLARLIYREVCDCAFCHKPHAGTVHTNEFYYRK